MLLISKLTTRVCCTTIISNKEKFVETLLPLVGGVIGPQSATYGS